MDPGRPRRTEMAPGRGELSRPPARDSPWGGCLPFDPPLSDASGHGLVLAGEPLPVVLVVGWDLVGWDMSAITK